MFLVIFLVIPLALCVYVETPLGVLEGRTEKSLKQTQYYAFEGVPYAKPPVGKLRFVDTVDPQPWSGIYNATFQRSMCTQLDRLTEVIVGSEDCLHLNVYTPSLNAKKKLPVMVYVFGGGFGWGSAKQCYNPELFIDEDTLVISFNHRLGVLGFFILDTPEVPGNAALRDVVMVLKWTQKYISYFGGDPNNVTVFSISSGAVMVDIIKDRPAFRNLFHKTILMSGNKRGHAMRFDSSRRSSKRILNALNINHVRDDTLERLQHVPVDVYMKLTKEANSDNRPYDYSTFDVTIELDHGDGKGIFFDTEDEEENCTVVSNIPMIVGHTSQDYFDLPSFLLNLFMSDREDFILPYDWNIDANETTLIGQKVKRLLFKDHSYNKESAEDYDALFTLLSHSRFMMPVYNRARTTSKCSKAPIYYYLFDFDGSALYHHGINFLGTLHGDELSFIFPLETKRADERSSDGWTRRRLIAIFTNFAKNGNPTPEISNLLPVTWKPFDYENENYLHFSGDLLPGVHPIHRVAEFWNGIKEKYVKKKRREIKPVWAL